MSTVTLTVGRSLELIHGPDDSFTADIAGTQLFRGIIYMDTGSQAAASGDTLSVDLAAMIATLRRNGKTITIRTATLASPAFNLTDNATMCFKTISLSAPTLTWIPTTTDYSTGIGIDATDVITRPWGVFVAWSEA